MNHQTIDVLLADDDKDDQFLFEKALKEIPMKTRLEKVNDGTELMHFLDKQLNSFPHILFLDLNLPKKNGLLCLEEIRKNESWNDISVAIYSSSSLESHVEEAFVLGANIYIKKPDSLTCLQKSLEKILTINWQYLTSGMNRDNFLLNL